MNFWERLFHSVGLALAAWRKPELFIALGLFEANRQREREEDARAIHGSEMDTSEPWDKFK